MKKLLLLIPVLLLSACVGTVEDPEAYDQESWKTMIAEDCRTFFDGCNTCQRAPGADAAACTRKACMEYEKPRCLDGESPTPSEPTADCGVKNTVCNTSDDCCGSMGLECQEVRTSDGGFAKRCLPVEVNICKSDCKGGVWDDARGCRFGVAPKDMVRCESIVGESCKTSTSDHRNTRECTDT